VRKRAATLAAEQSRFPIRVCLQHTAIVQDVSGFRPLGFFSPLSNFLDRAPRQNESKSVAILKMLRLKANEISAVWKTVAFAFSEVSLGTMTFGEDWGWGSAKRRVAQDFMTLIARAGGNFIDTANLYTNGK